MLNEHQIEQLKAKYEQFCYDNKIDSDKFDIDANIDTSLTYWENWNEISDKLDCLRLTVEDKSKENCEWFNSSSEIKLSHTDSIAIVGDRNSGKTNLAFWLMNNYKGNKKKYLYGYPKEMKNYFRISSWSDLLKLTDSIIFIDEIQKYIRLYDRRANIELMELLSFLSQQNNTLIFTTQLSQFITKGVEASIQTWFIKQMDVLSVKNGSKIRRILRETADPRITNKGMAIQVNEFIAWDSVQEIGFNGIHIFENQGIGKDWRNSNLNNDLKPDKKVN